MLAQQPVECLSVAHLELAGEDAGVVDTQEGVDVVHGLRAHVGELLDLGGCVLDLRRRGEEGIV